MRLANLAAHEFLFGTHPRERSNTVADTLKVMVTRTFRDEYTHVVYHPGEEPISIDPQSAQRWYEAGVAVILDQDVLMEQKSDELSEIAEDLGVDLEGAQKKEEKAKKIVDKAK